MPRLACPRRRTIFVDVPITSVVRDLCQAMRLEPCRSRRQNVQLFLLYSVRRSLTVEKALCTKTSPSPDRGVSVSSASVNPLVPLPRLRSCMITCRCLGASPASSRSPAIREPSGLRLLAGATCHQVGCYRAALTGAVRVCAAFLRRALPSA